MTVLACDVGGTRIKLGIVRDGAVLANDVIPAHSDRGLAERLPALSEALRKLCARQGIAPGDCGGVALGIPSLVDVRTGRILAEYGKYRDGPTVDLRAWGAEALGLPVAIENDTRMAMIGEWRHGAGLGCGNLVMITLGTGLGTSAVVEGQVVRGKHGQAGCLGGHLTVRYGGRRCSCGNVGCAEAEASTAFLGQIAAERPDFAASTLQCEPRLDYRAIIEHSAAGDACAQALLQHSIQVWGALAVNLIHAYDPELVIFGGGIMASAAILLPRLEHYILRHAHTPWGKVKVVASHLGDEAALMAAEWLVREQRGPSATHTKED